MALWDEVKARYPSPELIQLTNPETPGASVVNDTLGLKIMADVQADFLIYANITYLDTDTRHVSLGVIGVMTRLQMNRGMPWEQQRSEEERWISKLRGLAQSRGISKMPPTANSRYTPSIPNPDGQQLEPPFDVDRFQGLIPNAPDM